MLFSKQDGEGPSLPGLLGQEGRETHMQYKEYIQAAGMAHWLTQHVLTGAKHLIDGEPRVGRGRLWR